MNELRRVLTNSAGGNRSRKVRRAAPNQSSGKALATGGPQPGAGARSTRKAVLASGPSPSYGFGYNGAVDQVLAGAKGGGRLSSARIPTASPEVPEAVNENTLTRGYGQAKLSRARTVTNLANRLSRNGG